MYRNSKIEECDGKIQQGRWQKREERSAPGKTWHTSLWQRQ
jgi:hypothetical protein